MDLQSLVGSNVVHYQDIKAKFIAKLAAASH